MALESSTTLKEAQCNLIDVFSGDPRPTLVIDVSDTKYARGVPLEFANAAFTDRYGVLMRSITSGQIVEPGFIHWLRSPHPTSNEYLLGDLFWTCFIFEARFKVVSVATSGSALDSVVVSIPQHLTSTTKCQSSLSSRDLATKGSSIGSSVSDEKSGRDLTDAQPSGLSSLGSAPAALDSLHRSVDMLDVGFFEFDLEGGLITANKSWYALSGHTGTQQAYTEMCFLDLCHPDDIQAVMDAWKQLLEGKPTTFEMRWKHINSPTAEALGAQWVLSACLPLYDESGKLSSISGCTTDINNQKLNEQIAHARAEAQERARTSEERFIRFATVAPIAIFNFEAKKRMTYCNARWFEMTATVKKPFGGVDISAGFLEEDVSNFYNLINEATQDREVHSLEMRTRRVWRACDGRKAQFWVLASIFAEFTDEGSCLGCTGTLTDISEFKYAETLQRIRLDEALEAKRQQENFIDMTSHEMRNPLSAMVQCADSALAAVTEINNLLQATTPEQVPAATRNNLLEEAGLGLEGLQTIISCWYI